MSHSEKKRLYVHIGMHKTGTTSIQSFLYDNAVYLYSKKILYPLVGRHPNSPLQHSKLAAFFAPWVVGGSFAANGETHEQLLRDAFADEVNIAGCDDILLSSEPFCNFFQHEIEAFGEFFADYRISPIIFVRSYADYIDSAYQTMLMYNYTDKVFAESGMREWALQLDVFNICQNWANIAFDKKIIVRNFDALQTGNAVLEFADILKLNTAEMDRRYIDARTNLSLTPLQAVARQEALAAGLSLDSANAIAAKIGEVPSATKLTFISPELNETLTARYIEHMTALSKSDFVDGLQFDPEALVKRERQYFTCLADLGLSLDQFLDE